MTSNIPKGYDAFVTGAGYYSPSGWSTIRMTGDNRKKLLQNLCTNDLRRMETSGGCETFLTDVKGRVLSHLIVLDADDELLLLAPSQQPEPIIAHIDRYIIREDAALADVSDEVVWTAVSAAAAEAIVSDSLAGFKTIWAHQLVSVGGMQVRYVRSGLCWLHCYLVGAGADASSDLEANLEKADAVELSHEAFGALRIESGWPMWGVDFDAENLPQEVARNDQAISFTKGCYLGQETVARIDALGHVNKQLASVRFEGKHVPAIGAELIANGDLAGRITSACWSPQLGAPLAFAMVRRGHHEIGGKLQCEETTATVVATPAAAPSMA